ncbi:MAG: amidase family protein, partial [Pirellulaceae bacterium]|nr:amidase family protein [Pirellulaceae bacterium]
LHECFGGFTALLCPATVTTAPGVETTGDPAFNSPWSYAGAPTVSVPCGLGSDGLPCSLQLIAPPHQEQRLVFAARWCERVLEFAESPAGWD